MLQKFYAGIFVPLRKEYQQMEEGDLKMQEKLKLESVANKYNAQLAKITEEEIVCNIFYYPCLLKPFPRIVGEGEVCGDAWPPRSFTRHVSLCSMPPL